jgi:hypothetical protein
VKASVFEQIKRDKMDDGIINNNVFGLKKRGYLQPQYLIPTTGGAIPTMCGIWCDNPMVRLFFAPIITF